MRPLCASLQSCVFGWLDLAQGGKTFVEVAVPGVAHSRYLTGGCECRREEEVQCMPHKLFFFLTASAGIGPKVSEFAVKLDLASWSHVVHFMSIQA